MKTCVLCGKIVCKQNIAFHSKDQPDVLVCNNCFKRCRICPCCGLPHEKIMFTDRCLNGSYESLCLICSLQLISGLVTVHWPEPIYPLVKTNVLNSVPDKSGFIIIFGTKGTFIGHPVEKVAFIDYVADLRLGLLERCVTEEKNRLIRQYSNRFAHYCIYEDKEKVDGIINYLYSYYAPPCNVYDPPVAKKIPITTPQHETVITNEGTLRFNKLTID